MQALLPRQDVDFGRIPIAFFRHLYTVFLRSWASWKTCFTEVDLNGACFNIPFFSEIMTSFLKMMVSKLLQQLLLLYSAISQSRCSLRLAIDFFHLGPNREIFPKASVFWAAWKYWLHFQEIMVHKILSICCLPSPFPMLFSLTTNSTSFVWGFVRSLI